MGERLRRWWRVNIRGLHADGTRHRWIEDDRPLGSHECETMSYCHHYPTRCTVCGASAVAGYSVPEVR
jgi:hypothetical protein